MKSFVRASLVLLTLAAFTSLARGQDIADSGAADTLPFALGMAQRADVQKEVEITPDQAAKLKKLHTEFKGEVGRSLRAMLPKPADLLAMGERERKAKIAELAKKVLPVMLKVMDNQKTKLAKALKPEQIDRLQQITWQKSGSFAVLDTDLQKKLELTKPQLEDMKAIFLAFAEEIGTPGNGEKDRLPTMLASYGDKLTAVLTDSQKEKKTAALGEKFEFDTPAQK